MRRIVSLLMLVVALIGNAAVNYGGVVKEKQSGEPIVNAAVTLLSLPDSIYAGAAVTDASGRFSISEPEGDGKYTIKVTAPGCRALVVNNLSPAMEIFLEAWESGLQELVVTAKKQEMKMILQGFSFDPKEVVAHSNNALDVLKYAPLIELKDGKKPKLIGKANTEIHINGRKSQKSEEQILAELEAMPASNVKNIEMLVNTGSRYESDSDTGIINIEIREPHEGLLGMTRVLGEVSEKETGVIPSLTLDYSRNKFNVGGYAAFTQGMTQINNDYYYEDFLTWMTEESVSHKRKHSSDARISLAAGYAPSENQRIEISGRVSGEYIHATAYDNSIVNIGGKQEILSHSSTYRRPFNVDTFDAGLGYYIKTNSNGSNIQIDLNYLYTADHTDILNFYNEISLPQYKSHYMTWIFGHVIGKQIFNEHHSLQYGYNFGFDDTNDLSLYLSDPVEVNKYMHSSHYKPTEYRHTLLADYYWSPNAKFNLSIGIRAEYKDIKGELKLPEESEFHLRRWEPLPQITAQWNIKPLHILTFNVRRSIQWPYSSSMSPEKQWESENRYTTGNPDMLPVASYNADLTYYFLNYFTLKLDYKRYGNIYVNDLGPGEYENTLATTYRLFTGSLNTWSPSFYYKKNFFNYRWTMTTGVTYIFNKYNYLRPDGTPLKKSHSYIGVSFYNDITILPKQKFYGNLYFYLNSPSHSLSYQNNDWHCQMYLGLTKYFRFGSLQVMTPWIDLLQLKYKGNVETDNYKVTYKNRNLPWRIDVMFTYNFGNRSVRQNMVKKAE